MREVKAVITFEVDDDLVEEIETGLWENKQISCASEIMKNLSINMNEVREYDDIDDIYRYTNIKDFAFYNEMDKLLFEL